MKINYISPDDTGKQSVLNTYISLIIALLFSATAAHAELTTDHPGWKLALEKDGVEIYTRPYENSDIEAFKAVALLNAPLNNIMAVMANPNSCTEWVHGCTVSYGFDEASFNSRYAYSVNDLPWPVRDRDYVLKLTTWTSKESGHIMLEMHAVPDRKPIADDYQRVTVANTVYEFIPEGDKTRVIWLQHTEPAGVLPGWLVNALLVDIPYKSLKKLEEVAMWPAY
ncbi:MAG: START domain-containing protein, partial [Pseudomonadales bacterium]|nr:START domain-containing protein [Pseudomonadales bacterium]